MTKAAKQRYARLLGEFWRNPKVRRLSLEARGLLVTAWSYSADHMTDGAVPIDLLRTWAGKRYAAIMAELCRGSDAPGDRPFLTIETDAIDAVSPGWEDVNITRDGWAKSKADAADRKRAYRETKSRVPRDNEGDNGETPADVAADSLDQDEGRRTKDEGRSGEINPASAGVDPAVRIAELQARYPSGVLGPVFDALSAKRKRGKMATSVWLGTLEYLDAFDVDLVARSMRTFVEKHADKGEAYLRGIARGERDRPPMPVVVGARRLPSDAEYAESATDLEALGLAALSPEARADAERAMDDYAKGALYG